MTTSRAMIISGSGREALPFTELGQGATELLIYTYALTAAGWESLLGQIRPAKGFRASVLTCAHATDKTAYDAIERFAPSVTLRFINPRSHAKAILFPQKRAALVGSFNVTHPALASNIEFSSVVTGEDYTTLADFFKNVWENASRPCTRAELADSVAFIEGEIRQSRLQHETESMAHALAHDFEDRPDWLETRTLAPFQENLVAEIIDANWDARTGKVLQLPTGAGKTVIAAEVVRRLLNEKPNARILWVTHRKELLRQAFQSVLGQCRGLDLSDIYYYNPSHIDWLKDRGERTAEQASDVRVAFALRSSIEGVMWQPRPWSFVVVDEAHRYPGGSEDYRRFHASLMRGNALRLGLTATVPDMDDDFDRHWDSRNPFGGRISEEFLVESGYRARIDSASTRISTGFAFRLACPDAAQEVFLEANVREFDDDVHVNPAVVRAMANLEDRCRRVLVFAVTIEHANKLARLLGGRAIHSRLPGGDRSVRQTLAWFRESTADRRVLVSVAMLLEGVDLPNVDAMFLVRPTFSEVVHEQMIGRGLRGPAVQGTESCVFVDFTYQFLSEAGREISPQKFLRIGRDGGTALGAQPDVLGQNGGWLQDGGWIDLISDARGFRNVVERIETERLASRFDISRACGVSPARLREITNGEAEPSEGVIAKLCDFLRRERFQWAGQSNDSATAVKQEGIRRLARIGTQLRAQLLRLEETHRIRLIEITRDYDSASPATVQRYLASSDEVPGTFHAHVKDFLSRRGLYRQE